MDIIKLRSSLQFFIPEELYDIAPGQIVFFVPFEKTNQKSAIVLYDFFRFIKKLHKGIDVNLSIVPTDNELLIDNFACRNPKEIVSPYKVAVGPWETFVGIASEYYGVDHMTILDKVVHMGSTIRDSITKDHPVIVSLDPDKRQGTSRQQSVNSSNQSDFDMEMKIAIPEKGSLAERKLIAKEEKKLEKILRECAVLGIDLDIDRIKKKVEEDLKKAVDYKLIIKADRDAHIPLNIIYTSLDIYVADGEEYKLDLTAIEKAVYLAFLLYKDGICVQDTYGECRAIIQKIYGCLPYDERCEKETGGIRDKVGTTIDAHMNTMRGYFSTIRDAVAEKVTNPLVAEEFAIEGYKGSPYRIERTTPEIRAQVKELFNL